MRNNGARVNDERVTEWHDQTAVPKLAGQPIFDAANPFRWLIDQAVPMPSSPEAFVEFQGGDCLPGRVVDFVPAVESLPTAEPVPTAEVPVLVEPVVSLVAVVFELSPKEVFLARTNATHPL